MNRIVFILNCWSTICDFRFYTLFAIAIEMFIGTQMTQIELIYTDFFIFIAIEIAIEIFFYSSLILYFLTLNAIKNTVIPTRINVSFQMVW